MPVRVTQAKNIELGIRLVAALKKRNLHPRLIISGPPDPHDPENMAYFESLRTLCRRLGVEADVHFVFESGYQPVEPLLLDAAQVGELYRLCDVLFMPSHREGFGMPILEAGLLGIPVFCADTIPAAGEIGGDEVMQFSPDTKPNELADLVLEWLEKSPQQAFRRRVRQGFTWRKIYRLQILPLLVSGKP
jgi:glycosyltransferase involved in cell wall biosynthesis